MKAAELAVVRRAYARQMLALGGVLRDDRLARSFAAIPREDFLRQGPWKIRGFGRDQTIPGEPALVYQDILVALKPEKDINNGSPSLHAAWLHAARPKPGERVVHIGAGAGYYTAILARLVGARGRVTAVEFDPDLAALARENLASYRNVAVVQGEGAHWPRETCDLVYVNFAVDRPAPPWLDSLKRGGRLLFPLGSIARSDQAPRYGIGLRIERVSDDGVFAARSLGNAFFIRASGDAGLVAQGAEREALLAAFEKGGTVRSLHWRVPPPERALCVGDGWSLGEDEPTA